MTLAAQQRGKQQPAVTPAASEAAAETGAKSASSAAEAASGGASGGGGDGGGAGGRRGRRDSELARLDKMGRRGRRFTQWGAIVGTNLSSDDQLHPTGKFASYIGTHDEFFDDVADKTEDRAAAQARARGDEPAAKRRSRKPNKTTLAVQDAWLALKVEKLCQAARDGRIADLRQSVEVEKLGVEHHWRGSSALHLAVSKLQAVAVYYLLALGADRRAPRSNGLKGSALEMLEAHPGARKHDELHRAWRIVHKIMVEGKLIFSSAKEGDVDYVEFLARDVGLHPALGMRFLDVNARNQHGLAALHFAVMKREAAPSVRSLEAQLAAMKKEDAAEKLKVDALEREDGRRKKIEKQRGGRKPGDGLFAPKGQPAGGDAMVAMAKSNAKQKERARERERMRIQALVPPARRTERQFALVQRSMVALLLRCSADVNAETDHGNTPLDYCGDQEDLALELREIGARDGDAPPPDVTAGDSSAGGVGVRAQNLWGSHHAESRKLRLTSSLRCGNNKEGTPPFSLDDALRAMPLRELKDILVARGIDVERVHTKEQAEAVAKSRVYCLRNHPLSLEHWESKSWFRRQNHDAHVEASILIPSEEAAGVVWDAEADEWNSDDPDGLGGGQAGGYGSGGDEEVSGRNGGETAAGSRLASKKPSRRSSKSKIKVGGLPGSKMASRTGSRRNSTNPRQDMGVGEDGEEVQFTFDLRAAREERHAAENEAEADAIKKAQAKDGKGGSGKHDAREAARAAAEAARPRKHFPVRCDVLGMPAPQREDADASFAEIGEGPPLDEWGWPIQDGERGSRPGSRGSSRGSSRPGTAEGRTPRSARGGGGGGGGMASGFNTARSGQGAGGGFDGRGGGESAHAGGEAPPTVEWTEESVVRADPSGEQYRLQELAAKRRGNRAAKEAAGSFLHPDPLWRHPTQNPNPLGNSQRERRAQAAFQSKSVGRLRGAALASGALNSKVNHRVKEELACGGYRRTAMATRMYGAPKVTAAAAATGGRHGGTDALGGGTGGARTAGGRSLRVHSDAASMAGASSMGGHSMGSSHFTMQSAPAAAHYKAQSLRFGASTSGARSRAGKSTRGGGTIKGGGGMAGGLGGAGGVHGDGGVEMQLAKENRARENARKGRLRRKALEYRAETGDLDALRELLSSKDAVDAFAKGDIGRKQGARSGARRGSYGSRVF